MGLENIILKKKAILDESQSFLSYAECGESEGNEHKGDKQKEGGVRGNRKDRSLYRRLSLSKCILCVCVLRSTPLYKA